MKYALAIAILLSVIYTWGISSGQVSEQAKGTEVRGDKQVAITLPSPSPRELPVSVVLTGGSQVYQTFNNCGPAALSMALSFYGVNIGQQELGNELRPYQNTQGDNDDKSVTMAELAERAQAMGWAVFHRPAGDIATLKRLIAEGWPVVTRTLLNQDDDIGHYRVVYGYDEGEQQLIQNDSLQGQALKYGYQSFRDLWRHFGYEFLVLVPRDRQLVAESVLGQLAETEKAWDTAVKVMESEVSKRPSEPLPKLALAAAYYRTRQYEQTIKIFEEVERELPHRALWYQIEPLLAYYQLGHDEKIWSLSEEILNNGNRAFAELYDLRGDVLTRQGESDRARREYELAVVYNRNYDTERDW